MAWPTPKYSRSQVNRAGQVLIAEDPDEGQWYQALDVLNNWRACHGYPINTFQSTLCTKLRDIEPEALVAQRLKRTPSIISKLERFEHMALARMQDIGGLRAVVSTLPKARKLEKNYRKSRFTHALVNEFDYIAHPKESGYRSIHLVYKYRSDRAPEYDGLLLELQIRTRLQHAWASAVETMGTFLDHSLKSSEGPDAWLSFFALSGSAFACLENSALVPGYKTLSKQETFAATSQAAADLGVREKLLGFSSAVNAISENIQRRSFYLIILDLGAGMVKVEAFSRDRLEEASLRYTEVEKTIADGAKIQAVLVSAGSVESLRRAYPSYFLDTHEFLGQLERIEKLAVAK